MEQVTTQAEIPLVLGSVSAVKAHPLLSRGKAGEGEGGEREDGGGLHLVLCGFGWFGVGGKKARERFVDMLTPSVCNIYDNDPNIPRTQPPGTPFPVAGKCGGLWARLGLGSIVISPEKPLTSRRLTQNNATAIS